MTTTQPANEPAGLTDGLKDSRSTLEGLAPYLEPTIQPLIGMKTIQILLLREALDYLVLRTEDTREINEVVTPSFRTKREKGNDVPVAEVRRVAFLGGKQKAVESREFERLLRESWRSLSVEHARAVASAVLPKPKEQGDQEKLAKKIASLETSGAAQRMVQDNRECFLKDNLCLTCPRCALFGATSTESGKGEKPNIKHRIEYSTAFSLLPYEEVFEEVTFNAINDQKQITEQALFARPCVRPGTLFASIVTLRSATAHELMLVLKVLLLARSYGAESRTAGDVRNHIVGIVGGWEEVLTPLEFTLECEGRLHSIVRETERPKAIREAVEAYWQMCAQPSKVVLISGADHNEKERLNLKKGFPELLDAVRKHEIGRDFLKRAYQDVYDLRRAQGTSS